MVRAAAAATSVHSRSVLLDEDTTAADDDDEEQHGGDRGEGDVLYNFAAYNDRLLRHAIDEAGIWTQDCLLVELWTWDNSSHCLHQKGMWVDPLLHRNCRIDHRCPVCMLTQPEYGEDYVPATPVAPGEGLPGYLWSHLTTHSWADEDGSHHYGHHHHLPTNLFWSPRRSTTSTPANDSHHGGGGGGGGGGNFNSNHSRISLSSIATSITSVTLNRHGNHRHHHSIKWREIQAIAHDPHQPWNPRLLTMAALDGVKYVTAIPFRSASRDHHGAEQLGLVLFLCRDSGGDWSATTERNERYMHAAAQLIGSTYAIRQPWLTVVQEKRVEIQEALGRLKRHLGTTTRTTTTTTQASSSSEPVTTTDREDTDATTDDYDDEDWQHVSLCKLVVDDVASRVTTALTKAQGAGMKVPPVTSWQESFLTFVGVFWTLLLLTMASDGLVRNFGTEYEIVLGPFGAFVTLLYCLSSAPAAQPRNAILGQIISLVISISISRVDALTIWMKQSLSTALAVAAMAKLGVVHPPAGAAALIFASGGNFTWTNLASMLVGNVIAILSATIVNNWSDKRQYPTYWWGMNLLPDRCTSWFRRRHEA